VILRCTKKLLVIIGPSSLADPPPEPDPEDWYGNLLWSERRKCLLLTHSATLFTIFEPDVAASDLRATAGTVFGLIQRELRGEDLPPHTFGDHTGEQVLLARTADRSVLGCMNDMAFICEDTIRRSGGLSRTNISRLNRALRRNINSARAYERPIDLTLQRLGIEGRR
jgi:hypothetical protein